MLIPLSLLEKGACAVVKRLPFSREMAQRLFDIGLRVDSRVEVLLNRRDIVLKMDCIKIALDEIYCNEIMVAPLES